MLIKKFKSAYGIKDLQFEKSDTRLRNALIYSPNGTFKTSFSEAMLKLSEGLGTEVHDRLAKTGEGMFQCEIEIDNKIYKQNNKIPNLLVYSKELLDPSNSNWSTSKHINNLLISPKYQTQLEKILNGLSKIRNHFLENEKYKIVSKVATLIPGSIAFTENMSITEIELNIKAIIETAALDIPQGFDIKKINQKAYTIIDEDYFHEGTEAILKIIEKEMSSGFFEKGFGIDEVNEVISVLEQNRFLSERRKIVINDSLTFISIDDFKSYVSSIIDDIVKENPEIHVLKSKIVKEAGTAKEAHKVINQLSEYSWIQFYSNGRSKIINSFIKSGHTDETLQDHLVILDEIRDKIEILKSSIESERSFFDDALKIHKERFQVPFEVRIDNKMDNVINENLPEFRFYPNSKIPTTKDYNETRNILSSGEKTAFDIINLIVEYELLEKKSEAIVILDDLVETFDYGNRVAFIEYIQELKDKGTNVIVLTHNFEFFRTLQKRIKWENSYIAYNENGVVTVNDASNIYLNLNKIFKIKDLSKGKIGHKINGDEYFLSSLPFVREITRYLDNDSSYTQLFHYKKEGKNLTIKELIDNIQNDISEFEIDKSCEYLEKETRNYYDYLFDVCDSIIAKNIHNYDLRRKMILSMGCRILADKYMIDEDFTKIEDLKRNQTRALYDKYKHMLTDEITELISKVLLSTSEFIHVNSFMYEPLVDMPAESLTRLYSDLRNFKNKVYK